MKTHAIFACVKPCFVVFIPYILFAITLNNSTVA